jgi:hypothetical protein
VPRSAEQALLVFGFEDASPTEEEADVKLNKLMSLMPEDGFTGLAILDHRIKLARENIRVGFDQIIAVIVLSRFDGREPKKRRII